jgi:hypothetical protein
MEDFKIILYVLAAFAWMFYKNYEKVKQEAAKRNPSKPIDDGTETATSWPPSSSSPAPTNVPAPIPSSVPSGKQILKAPKPMVRQRAMSASVPLSQKRNPLVKESIDYKTNRQLSVEGGSVRPSESVHFVDSTDEPISWQNPIIAQIKEADFRQAFILSEILQRPKY